ncbi:GerAB/ArcD/ProY family transporter [Bacillus sp. 3255]|uniref:GerAB/ArcD/ProY family transporter n=1 Tax=Bacillus sp. 3255 TaxID=2817904 RepID=UPI002857A042|nr:GerAB/ArcD/ProY family transporter [Bacillus sp. 3255]MDR6882600.1 spore germination protein (amino acid permease) [Bacillus sp. 3255]
MPNTVRDKFAASPYLLFFVIYTSIVDAGMMYFQREIVKSAGYDAWTSILITGVTMHVFIWLMFQILSSRHTPNTTIVEINRTTFGKLAGTVLNLALACHFILGAFSTFRTYLEVLQVWIFPAMQMMPIALIIFLLIYYAVSGGFRTVAGLCFWGAVSTFLFIAPLTIRLIPEFHPQNLLPVWNHSAEQIVRSTHTMIPYFLGFEVLLLVYPFIQTPAKSQKWAHGAVLTATLMYLQVGLSSFMYYSEGQIVHIIWPTLNMISIMQFPLMQRVEYLVISIWFIKMLANISLSLWAACHSLKLSVRAKPSVTLWIILALFVIAQLVVKDYSRLQALNNVYERIGMILIFGYLPLMYIVTRFRRKKNGG